MLAAVPGCDGSGPAAPPAAAPALPTAEASAALPLAKRHAGTADPRRVALAAGDAGRLLVVDRGGDVQLWDVAGEPQRLHALAAGAADAVFAAAGRAIFVAESAGAVALWSTDGTRLWRRTDQADGVRVVAAAGQRLACGTAAGEIQLWDFGGRARSREPAHDGPVLSLALSPDGTHLVSEGADTRLRIWRLEGDSLTALASPRAVNAKFAEMLPNLLRWDVQWGWDRSLAFFADGESFVAADFSGGMQIWSLAGEIIAEVDSAHAGHHLRAVAVAGDWIVSAGFDGTARLRRRGALATAVVMRGHQRAVTSVAVSDAGRVVAAGLDGTVRIWDRTGRAVVTLPRREAPLHRQGQG